MMVVSWGWEWSMRSSMRVVAWASGMFLFFREEAGGRFQNIENI
jgi:hypothetical protein